MKKTSAVALGLAMATFLLLVTGGAAVHACDFDFNYDSIEAPLGTEGKIGVQVVKTHTRCTMPDELGYDFDWDHIQVLGETQWEEVERNVYEKWFRVSLSSPGEGYLRISSECSKEGYNEKVLPITVIAGSPDGSWQAAMNGTYPFSDGNMGELAVVFGQLDFDGDAILVDGERFDVPHIPSDFASYSGAVQVYYQSKDGTRNPVLVVGESIFIRFDQYTG